MIGIKGGKLTYGAPEGFTVERPASNGWTRLEAGFDGEYRCAIPRKWWERLIFRRQRYETTTGPMTASVYIKQARDAEPASTLIFGVQVGNEP